MEKTEWIRCPVCGSKTRLQLRVDTELKNFPLYCPKCKQERILRKCGVDEDTIEKIRIYDRADFNATRRFYRYLNDIGEYLEGMADTEQQTEIHSVADLLNEIENENLYQTLLTVDKRTLQIVLLKMQGYSTKEIAPIVHLTTGAIYARLDHLRKKLRQFKK